VEEWPDVWEECFQQWGTALNDMINLSEVQDTDTLIKVKKVAIDVVRLLCFKFGGELEEYIKPFFDSIWKLVPVLPAAREFNKIVQSVINYVTDALNDPTLKKAIED